MQGLHHGIRHLKKHNAFGRYAAFWHTCAGKAEPIDTAIASMLPATREARAAVTQGLRSD
jgi:hypothetical protein